MTFEDRVRALEPLGFSERQTRFLVTVALHSGFCLRRQYMAFAGLKYGAGVRDFLDRLVARKVARRCAFRRDRGHVYHLHTARPLRGDWPDRQSQPPPNESRAHCAKADAAGLRARPTDVDWYATEHDKVALFTTRFSLPAADLPRRIYPARRAAPEAVSTTRYFIHKLPIGLAGDQSKVSFAFLVTDTSGQAFAQFLRDHERLLSHLRDWEIVLVLPGTFLASPPARRRSAASRRTSTAVPESARPCGPSSWNGSDLRMTTFAGGTMDDLRQFQERHRRFLTPECTDALPSVATWRGTRCSAPAATRAFELSSRPEGRGSRRTCSRCATTASARARG